MKDKTIRFWILILFSVGMLSCNSTSNNNTYTINGNVSNAKSGKAILAKLDLVSNKKVIVDSTSIVNGKFTFTGSLETPYLHLIFINDNKKGINDDKISEWNHASNLKGWDIVSKLYGVRAVPQNFLIDPKGIIIAKNTSSEKLNEILDKEFNSTGNKN